MISPLTKDVRIVAQTCGRCIRRTEGINNGETANQHEYEARWPSPGLPGETQKTEFPGYANIPLLPVPRRRSDSTKGPLRSDGPNAICCESRPGPARLSVRLARTFAG